MISISNKIPMSHSFQRLQGHSLDDTYIFETKEDAQEYAANNGTAYPGQLLFIKEYRDLEMIKEEDENSSALYYITDDKTIEPVCWFDYNNLVFLLETLKQANYKRDMNNVYEELKNSLVGKVPSDYIMTFITQKPIPASDMRDINHTFSGCNATYIQTETLLGGSTKYTYQVKDFLNLDDFGFATATRYDLKVNEIIYASLPFVKGERLWSIFSDCNYLNTCYFPYADWSSIKEFDAIFKGCTRLENIDTHTWDTSNLEDFAGVFYGCESLKNIDSKNWRFPNAIYLNNVFYDCKSLEYIDVSNWGVEKATDLSGLFFNCEKLKTIEGINNWDFSKADDIRGMFSNCKSLTKLDLRGWNTRDVRRVSNMFSGCSNIEEIDLSGWHTYGIFEMSYMFSNCPKLKKINLSGWALDGNQFNNKTTDRYINMFKGCTSLTELITSGCNLDANYVFTTAYNNR